MWSYKLLLVSLLERLDSEGGFRTGCRNVSRQQQSFSGLQSPRWWFSIKVCYPWVQIIFLHSSTHSCVCKEVESLCDANSCVFDVWEPNPKGLAKLGNIFTETLLRMQMFSSLAARETCVAETNLLLGKQKMFLPGVKNIFASRTQILRPKHMFPSLATPGNITRNIVSVTMFPSLARP